MSKPTISQTDLLALAQTDASSPLPPSAISTILSQPPFILVPGTFNVRDLGLIPGSPIRPGLLYRSGGFLSDFPAEGRTVLKDGLKITKMFDLRSEREHVARPDPEVDGVEVVWEMPEDEDAVVAVEDFVEGEGEKGYVKMYLDVMKVYRAGIRRVLEFVRDGEEREVGLVHCTAGRDRTGVMAALLLTLAGASAETITLDWMLSRIGIEPVREQMLAVAKQGSMGVTVESVGFSNLINLRISCWNSFLGAVDSEYGGLESYVTKTLGFSEEDVAKIKRNLVLQD